jgi:hypothetical protein
MVEQYELQITLVFICVLLALMLFGMTVESVISEKAIRRAKDAAKAPKHTDANVGIITRKKKVT